MRALGSVVYLTVEKKSEDKQKKNIPLNILMYISNTFRMQYKVIYAEFNKFEYRVCLGFFYLEWLSCSHLSTPSARVRYDAKSIFKQSLTGFNSVFFLLDLLPHQGWRTSLSYYLPIAGGRIIGFIPFPRVLVLCEMQSTSSRIWTRVAVSISYYNNHYSTGSSWEWFPYQSERTPSDLLFFHRWREQNVDANHSKAVRTIWNVNGLVQDLNAGNFVYFEQK